MKRLATHEIELLLETTRDNVRLQQAEDDDTTLEDEQLRPPSRMKIGGPKTDLEQ